MGHDQHTAHFLRGQGHQALVRPGLPAAGGNLRRGGPGDPAAAAVPGDRRPRRRKLRHHDLHGGRARSEEHTPELQSLMRISYAVFCLKKKQQTEALSLAHYSTTAELSYQLT